MSLFENASLIVTPNAQKAGKLYAIKPTSGAGDLDVVRATSRTRVNEQGLVEIPRTNLVLRSEEFDNASWIKSVSVGGTISVTADYSTAPDSTLTADRLLINTISFGAIAQSRTVTSGVPYTSSIYAKSNTGSSYTYQLRDGFSGVLKTITITPDWQRFDLTFTSVGTTSELQLRTLIAGASDISIWGAQLEIGNTATEYIPTTSSIRTRFAGITQDGASASNIPALDYTNGSCPSILVEPQRTNLLLRSEEFDNASWIKTRGSIIANATIAPDGSPNADKFTETTFINNSSGIERQINVTNGLSYSSSAFFKKGNVKYASVSYFIVGGNQGRIIVDLDTKELTFSSNVLSYKIEQFDNDYIRISITIIANATASCFFAYLHTKISNNINYNGDGTGFTYLWGAQLEAGSNATSYIPTTASAVTRNADVISKTGISSLINSEEGCFYIEASAFINSGSFRAFSLSNGTDNNRLSLNWSSLLNRLLLFVNIGGVTVVNNDIIGFNQTNNNKVLVKWGGGTYKLFVNGVLSLNLTSLTMPTANLFTRLGFDRGAGGSPFEGNVNEIIVFPTQLTDQQCIDLTTI